MKRRSAHSAGFTLIELIVVLGISALILVSVLSARPRAAGARVNATARSIAATLQLARARAMATSSDVIVAIDPLRREFGFPNAMHRLPQGMSIDVTVAQTERAENRGGIRYYSDGQSSGGEIRLSYEGRTQRIAVNWFTGEPRLTR